MIFIIFFIFGIIVGAVIANVAIFHSEVGTLRIDTSDPNDNPYFFLELNKGAGDISSRQYVLLKVSTQNYISRK